jgi:lipopolysaccharide/colanic/teichoic acid biosynthesis glycosyltransferase
MYSPVELKVKRAIDVAASAAGLAATAPLLAAIALLVRRSSPGPALFRQARVGRGGLPFEMLKFRTMRAGGGGPEVTAGGDARITPVGRFLRRTKLDELPELLNVLRGDMSLVGPRPEVPRYVALYTDEERAAVHGVRPGLTDPATVRFRNEEDVLARAADPQKAYADEVLPVKIRMYKEYLERASLAGDLRILLETARVVLFPRAAARAGRECDMDRSR